MRWILAFGFCCAATVTIWGADFHDFDRYQGVYTQEEVRDKIKTYLEKDRKIQGYYRLTEEALTIGNLELGEEDYKLALATTVQEKSSRVKEHKGLQGMKIALDPGHFGGIYARLEQRFVSVAAGAAGNDEPIAFDEGTLTYLTAIELKKFLEAEGAEVMITRSGIGQGAIKENFFEWLKNEQSLWESKESLSQVFRTYYNRQDLRARAAKINAFGPDLAIIIHYNAHLTEEEKQRKLHLTHSDFNLIFVPGAFGARELSDVDDRYEFLRLIVTDDVEKSIALSEAVAEQFTIKLNVPLISDDEGTPYIENASLKQAPGVYSRNLALTRLVHGPLCYGETLIQNSIEEFQRLGAKDITIDGVLTSSRVKEVAEAYFAGIKVYYGETSE